MVEYIRTVDHVVNTGLGSYPSGSVFEFMKRHPNCISEKGMLVSVKPIGHPVEVFIWDSQLELLDFTPSPLYNHAVYHGFNAEPAFFQEGCNAILERIYSMCGPFSFNTDLETLITSYVHYDDLKDVAVDPITAESYRRIASMFNQRTNLIERLQKVIGDYNKAGTIENFKG